MTYTLKELQEMMDRNGGNLDLSGCTGLTSLPDGLTVGRSLYLIGCRVKNPSAYIRLQDGDYVQGKYLYADGILTHIRCKRKVGKYTFYQGKIKGKNVLSDGTYYAHCKTIKDGVADLLFKTARERGQEQYSNLTLDSVMTAEEAITMYRVITGACQAGTASFVESLGKLKDKYTVREVIDITDGQYNSEALKRFFGG